MRIAIKKRVIFEIFVSLLLTASVSLNFLQENDLEKKKEVIISQTYMSDSLWSISQKLQSKVVDQHETMLYMSEIIDIQIDVIRAQNYQTKKLLKELNAAPKL